MLVPNHGISIGLLKSKNLKMTEAKCQMTSREWNGQNMRCNLMYLMLAQQPMLEREPEQEPVDPLQTRDENLMHIKTKSLGSPLPFQKDLCMISCNTVFLKPPESSVASQWNLMDGKGLFLCQVGNIPTVSVQFALMVAQLHSFQSIFSFITLNAVIITLLAHSLVMHLILDSC